MTEMSRHTGRILSQAMSDGTIVICDRHGNPMLELRRVKPGNGKGEI
ncbi:MAG: hypothetical protein M3Y33_00525 [Actinomycetota bacterium]|nr:hypothetical protein [Actinomycetota bacterium]